MVVDARSEPAVDAFFALSLDLLCIADTEGRFLKLNPAWRETLGYRLEDLEGITFLDLVHPDDMPATLEAIGQLENREQVLHFRNRYRCKDGGYRDIEWLSNSPDGKVIYACARDVTDTVGAAERKLDSATEELAAAEKDYRVLFETMSQGVVIQDRDGAIVDANPAAERLLGLSLDQMTGRTSMDPRWRTVDLDGDEISGEQHPAMVSLRTGEVVCDSVMGVYVPEHDQYRWLLITATPIFDEGGGQASAVFTTFSDVTERIEAERAQRGSEAKYRIIADYTFDWEWWRSPDGSVVYSSPAAFEITGYPAESFVDDPDLLTRIAHDEDRDAVEAHLRDPNAGEKGHGELSFRIVRPDGEIRSIEHRCRKAISSDGDDLGVRASNRDVTERDRASAALRLKNQVFDASVAANSIADPSGCITECNDAFLALWGYSDKAEIVGRPIPEFLKDPEAAGAIVQALTETGVWEGDYLALRADGETRVVHGMATTLTDAGGETIGYQSAVVDVTESRAAEAEIRRLNAELEERVQRRTAQLAAANRELEAFAYSVSHDLRAPLRSIDGFSHALLEDYDEKLDDEGRDFLHRIRRSTQQMARLIDDMLKLSRLTRASMKYEEVDVSALAEESVAQLEQGEPGRAVETAIDPGIQVLGDRDLVRAAVENLVGNAWKFTGKNERAAIRVRSIDVGPNERGFSVSDNGAGFDMRYADKLFGAFQRLHRSEEFPGTGIGLATVQRVANRHGGRVWAEGAVDEGATFYMAFPTERVHEEESDAG